MYAYSIFVNDLNVCCLLFSYNSKHIDSALHPCALRSIQYSSISLFWFLRSLFNLGGKWEDAKSAVGVGCVENIKEPYDA